MVNPSILHYCQYQERCHKEVRNKLYEIGFTTDEVNRQIAELIESGILNEERFAIAFARGKFRLLQWGRIKIKQQLKLRGISEYCIKKALKEIDNEEYSRVLTQLAVKKLSSLKRDKNTLLRKAKTCRYLLQKGYEKALIINALK